MLRIRRLHLQLGERDERAVGRLGVVDGRLRVAVGIAPGVGDTGEPEDRLCDIPDGQPDAPRCRPERHDDRSRTALDLERQRVGPAAPALPAAASAEDLDDLELGAVDRATDGRTDLASLRATEADEPVAVADHDRDRELEPATGIGHPLDHIDVQDLVVEPGEELVDDLGLTEG